MNYRNLVGVTVIFMLVSCMVSEEPLDNYVHLEYNDFMKLSNDEIADSLAIILNVAPVTYNKVVSIGMFFFDNLKWAIEEGHEYIAEDSAKIIVWVDEEESPCYVTYDFKRIWFWSGGNWTYDEDSVVLEFKSNLEKTGVDLNYPYDLRISKNENFGAHWYRLHINQIYIDSVVHFPVFYGESDSDINKVYRLLVSRWYTNLDDITDTLSEQALKDKAGEYFENSGEVISISDELAIMGYKIVKDKLCRKIGSAVIDEYGSELYLYIDVQNGEVIREEALYFD